MSLTKEQIAAALPATLKGAATDQFTNHLNQVITDPIVAEQVRENFIGYTAVLKDGKFKVEDYLNAVIYVSFKVMGLSNKDSYMRTFPDRYQRLLAAGTDDKTISTYISAYNKNKLVNLILDQTLVPVHVLNQDLHQKAINHLATLMVTANSEKVQVEAAIGLVNATKRPESKGPLINIDQRDSSGLNELKATLANLAQKQIELIESGVSPKDIAGSKLIEGGRSGVP